MADKEKFGVFIAKRRKELNLTQKNMADQLCVTESTVSKWERGVTYPDITLVKTICELLEISESELFASSLDLNQRAKETLADKYLSLQKGYRLFWYISYGIALVTCFICNIAVGHTLDWFFIVLTSIMVAFSLTTLPFLVTKKKGLWTFAGFNVSLALLLMTCCIMFQQNWFWVAEASILYGMIVLFLPSVLKSIPVPDVIANYKALFSVLLDTVLAYGLIAVILDFVGSLDFMVKSAIFCTIGAFLVWFYLIIIRYTRLNGLMKAGICTLMTSVYVLFMDGIVNRILGEKLVIDAFHANLTVWNEATVEPNVNLIIFLSVFGIGIVFLLAGTIRQACKK